MKAEQLLDALGNVDEAYIQEAAPCGKKAAGRRIRRMAAAVAVAAFLLLAQTAPGVAALEYIRETASRLVETMFPPKHIAVEVEGSAEAPRHEAAGQVPREHTPGFVIYYDAERYQMTEEDGAFYIRPVMMLPTREAIRADNAALLAGLGEEEAETVIDALLAEQEAFQAALPACEMEIRRLPGVQPAEAAERSRETAADMWETVTEVTESAEPAGWMFSLSTGETWDAPREQRCFTSDGQGGVFQIRVRYFQEAAEGHGARLLQMLSTFEALAPS